MCIVSNVGDEWSKRQRNAWVAPPQPFPFDLPRHPDKNDTEHVKKLVKALEGAREKDVKEGNEECADKEKLAFIDDLIDTMKIKLADAVLEDESAVEEIKSLIVSLEKVKGYV